MISLATNLTTLAPSISTTLCVHKKKCKFYGSPFFKLLLKHAAFQTKQSPLICYRDTKKQKRPPIKHLKSILIECLSKAKIEKPTVMIKAYRFLRDQETPV